MPSRLEPSANPFVYQQPVGTLPCFVGRWAVLKQLLPRHTSFNTDKAPAVGCTALLGGPRSGVTSTLQHLAQTLLAALPRQRQHASGGIPLLPVYIDLAALFGNAAKPLSVGSRANARFVAALYDALGSALRHPNLAVPGVFCAPRRYRPSCYAPATAPARWPCGALI